MKLDTKAYRAHVDDFVDCLLNAVFFAAPAIIFTRLAWFSDPIQPLAIVGFVCSGGGLCGNTYKAASLFRLMIKEGPDDK